MLKLGGPLWKQNLCSTDSAPKAEKQSLNPASSSLREVTVSIIRHLGSSTQPAALRPDRLYGRPGVVSCCGARPPFSLLSVGCLLRLKSTINSLRCTHTFTPFVSYTRPWGVNKLRFFCTFSLSPDWKQTQWPVIVFSSVYPLSRGAKMARMRLFWLLSLLIYACYFAVFYRFDLWGNVEHKAFSQFNPTVFEA